MDAPEACAMASGHVRKSPFRNPPANSPANAPSHRLSQINDSRIQRPARAFRSRAVHGAHAIIRDVFQPASLRRKPQNQRLAARRSSGARAHCGIAPQAGLTSGTGSPSPTVGRVCEIHISQALKTPLVLLCHRFFWATDYRVKLNAAPAKARFSFVSSKSSK